MSKQRLKKIDEVFQHMALTIPRELNNQMMSGIAYDSRRIQKNNLFIAVPGFKRDGHQYLPVAAERGALAAVVERKVNQVDLPQIQVNDSRQAMAEIAANFYRPEIDALQLVGITGTNGKTTTSYLIRSILDTAHINSGLIGTVAYEYGGKKFPAPNTTPEAPDICRMLFEMQQEDYTSCVLEVSSHALALKRVEGLRFRVGLFTNLSRDHLDFHHTEEAYFQAKKHLFDLLTVEGQTVVNADDSYGQRLIAESERACITYGLNSKALIYPIASSMDMAGMRLTISTPPGELEIHSSLSGQFNVYNILSAIGVALAMHIPLESVRKGIERVKEVPGRLQSLQIKKDIFAVVDYAHTPDALEKALQALRPLAKKRLIVVFGAGGDRDKGKRPLMGQIAERLADYAIVTSDNPRSEPPRAIIEDILAGMNKPEKRTVIEDRHQAIAQAVALAEQGDLILIAGKGHETYQEVNGVRHPFDDRQIVLEAARSE